MFNRLNVPGAEPGGSNVQRKCVLHAITQKGRCLQSKTKIYIAARRSYHASERI